VVSRPAAARGATALARVIGQQRRFDEAGRAEAEPEPDHREGRADPAGTDNREAERGGGLDGEDDRDHHR
jgi:hypothetical protein